MIKYKSRTAFNPRNTPLSPLQAYTSKLQNPEYYPPSA